MGRNIPRIVTRARNALWYVSVTDPTNQYTSDGPYMPKGSHYFYAGVMTNMYLNPAIWEPPFDRRYAAFFPSEARFIDLKIDDGMPLTGNVLSVQSYSAGGDNWAQLDRGAGRFCSTGGVYNNSDISNGCALAVKAGF